jgi:hypothetical protein
VEYIPESTLFKDDEPLSNFFEIDCPYYYSPTEPQMTEPRTTHHRTSEPRKTEPRTTELQVWQNIKKIAH